MYWKTVDFEEKMTAILIKIYQSIVEVLARWLLFNRNMPDGFLKTANIEYSKTGKMDLFRPEKATKNIPVIIYIHGGGWTTGSKETSARQCAIFAREGYLVINMEYRLGPKYKHPAQIEDIANVLRWLNKHAKKFNADTSKIFFAGSSAGAHLSCLSVCIATNDSLRESIGIDFPIKTNQVAGSLLIYGGYNMETIVNSGFFMIKTMVKSYTGTKNPAAYELKDQISPVHHITNNFPPAFITAGERDPLYGQTLELIDALKEKGRFYETLLFNKKIKNAKHAFINFYYRECSKQAYEKMIAFLKKQSVGADIR